jgi:2-isopropylmalate synthase
LIGANAFSHSSGIHVDGFLKQRETYEIMRPEDVGMTESRVGSYRPTGRHGLLESTAQAGLPAFRAELDQTYLRFLIVADKKQEVFDEESIAILHDEIHPLPPNFELQYLHIYSGTSAIPTATVGYACATTTGKAPANWRRSGWMRFAAPFRRFTETSASLLRYEIHASPAAQRPWAKLRCNWRKAGQ